MAFGRDRSRLRDARWQNAARSRWSPSFPLSRGKIMNVAQKSECSGSPDFLDFAPLSRLHTEYHSKTGSPGRTGRVHS